jgi:general secretion pathway protein H
MIATDLDRRRLSARARARGLTLIEVLIVMAIAVFLVGGMAFASGQVQRSRLKSGSSKIAAAVRAGFQRASSTGRDLRLVLDFEKHEIWLEESKEKMALKAEDTTGTGGADPATAAEKQAQAEASRISIAGPQAPKAAFEAIAGPSGQPQQLPAGIEIFAVDAQHEPAPRTSGRGYVYFFGSQVERASVQLKIKGSDSEKDVFSIVIAPLTGKANIVEGPVAIVRPRDDAEASEAEDDGR